MWISLLMSVAASVANALIGRFFPGHPKVTPEVIAQAQQDRADVLQSQKDARREADAMRADVRDRVARAAVDPAHPSVFKHDANELPPSG